MDKDWYKSMTFWGAFGWAVFGVLEAFKVVNPVFGTAAQAVAAGLTIFGIRRAMN